MTRSGVASAARKLGSDAAVAHHQNAVRHSEHLGQVAGDHYDRRAARCQLEHEPIDLGLGPDVDPAGRLVEEKDARLPEQPFREHDLLLITAREVAHELLGLRACECASSPIISLGGGTLARDVDQAVAIDELAQDAPA